MEPAPAFDVLTLSSSARWAPGRQDRRTRCIAAWLRSSWTGLNERAAIEARDRRIESFDAVVGTVSV